MDGDFDESADEVDGMSKAYFDTVWIGIYNPVFHFSCFERYSRTMEPFKAFQVPSSE